MRRIALGLSQRGPAAGLLRSRGGNPDLAWIALLQANATYAWTGASGLTLATWTDVKAGVVATAGGTGTSIGTLAGKPTAVFNGSGRYATGALPGGAVAQPFALLVAFVQAGNVPSDQYLVWGAASVVDIRFFLRAARSLRLYAGGFVSYDVPAPLTQMVGMGIYNGTTSSLRLNGASVATGDVGDLNFSGSSIGIGAKTSDATVPFIGSIADVIIVAGADYAARAATIEAAALVRYGL